MMKRDDAPDFLLTDLIRREEWQEIQDDICEVCGVILHIVDTQGRRITGISRPSSLSVENSEHLLLEKLLSLPAFLNGGAGAVDEEYGYESFPGLWNYLVPLKVPLGRYESRVLGYMIIGPVIFLKRREREEFQALAGYSSADMERLWNIILQLRVFSYKGIHALLEMVDNLATRILNLSYDKWAAGRESRRRAAVVAEIPPPHAGESPDEFFKILLELVLAGTHATRGSVMLLDRLQEKLILRISSGLPQDIAAGISVAVSDGVAGLAARQKKSFLLNEDVADRGLREKMRFPDLASSAVVPIEYRGDVYGVISVSCDRHAPTRFDENTVDFLTKAAHLLAITLESPRQRPAA